MRHARIRNSLALVEIDARIDRSRGGIHIPDTATEQNVLGTVIAVGPGRFDRNGYWRPQCLAVGDRVVVGKYNGYNVTAALDHRSGTELWIVETLPDFVSDEHPGDVYLYQRV